jgi:hypothetical protein
MYQLIFEDGSEFQGGEPNCSLWDQILNKPIKSITYWLAEGSKYQFSDFEEYNHCVERVQGINTPLNMVSKALIMGRIGKRVYQVVYDLKEGTFAQTVVKYGEEYNGKALSGWKQGILYEQGAFPGPKLKKIEL